MVFRDFSRTAVEKAWQGSPVLGRGSSLVPAQWVRKQTLGLFKSPSSLRILTQPGSGLPSCSFPGLEQKHLKYDPMGRAFQIRNRKVCLGLIFTSFSCVLASTSFEVVTLLSLVLRYLLSSSSNSFHSWLATSRFSGDVLSCSHPHYHPWGLLSILDLGAVRFIFSFF